MATSELLDLEGRNEREATFYIAFIHLHYIIGIMSGAAGAHSFFAGGRSQFLHLLLNLFGAAGWPTASSASLNCWPRSCTIFYGKCTSSSAGHQHLGNQSLGGNDTPTRVQARARQVPFSAHWLQLFFTLPHLLSIFVSTASTADFRTSNGLLNHMP